jgi:glycosyltransferase involved in cell wall biosynthesis/SAM-dependent methyltransferase
MAMGVARRIGRRLLKPRPPVAPPAGLLGAVDSPSSKRLWRAVPVTFEGWGIDGVDLPVGVDVIVGSNRPVSAYIGLARPDIPVHLGSSAASPWCGWRADVDLRGWPDDTVRIRVIARGAEGAPAVLMDRIFTLRNDGFAGQILEPSEGTAIRDGVLDVTGWAVLEGRAPATVQVAVDGVTVGNARLRLVSDELPVGTDPRVRDFAGFQYSSTPIVASSGTTTIDVIVTGLDGTSVSMPSRHVSFVADTTSVEDASHAAMLRARSLSMEARPAQVARRAVGGRPRLLVFTPGLGSASTETFVHQLLSDLIQHLGSCVVVSPTSGVLHADLERIGAEVVISSHLRALDLESYEGHVRELVPFIIRCDADIILLNTLGVAAEADAAQRAGVPTLWAIHESFRAADWRGCHPYVRERLTTTLLAASRLIFETDTVSASFSDRCAFAARITMARSIEVRPSDTGGHPVDGAATRGRLGISCDAVVLLSVGTQEQGHSPPSVAEAFAVAAATNDDAMLVLVGSYSPRFEQGLRRLVSACGLSNRILVQSIDPDDDIRDWYAMADVLVMASETQTSRHSVLQAMALCVPVLSASVAGVADAVSDGSNGWLCPLRDIGALSTAIRRVLALPSDTRRAIGEAACETVRRHHSQSRLGTDYAQLIEEVMKEGLHTVGRRPDVAMDRLDHALDVLQAMAETAPPAGVVSGGSTGNGNDALADFNRSAPFVRDGIASFIGEVARGLSPGARVIDIGAGDAPYRDFFSHVEYITVDWEHSSHAGAQRSDIIASADSLPFADASADAVLMTELLEHVSVPSAVLREAARVLRPHGEIALTVPFVWMLHEMPHDYFRYTPSALQMLFKDAGFDQVVVRPRGDYFSTLAQLMQVTPQWISAVSTGDGLDDRRHLAGRTLEDLSHVFAALAPLDAQGLLPLGFNVSARRVD